MYPPRPPQRLRPLCRLISTWLIGGGTALTALSTQAVELPTVEVIGEKFPGEALVNSGSDGDTVYRLNQEGMAVYGSRGGTNPYALIANLPGVNAQSPDPYDMANVPGGNKGLRIRGEASGHGSIGEKTECTGGFAPPCEARQIGQRQRVGNAALGNAKLRHHLAFCGD